MEDPQRRSKIFLVFGGLVVIIALAAFLIPSLIAQFYFGKGLETYRTTAPDRLEQARRHFNQALSWNPKHPQAHAYRGLAAFGQRGPDHYGFPEWPDADWAEAARHFEAALQYGLQDRDPVLAELTHSNMARAYRKIGNFSRADEILREHLRLYPHRSFIEGYLLASDDYLVNNNAEEGIRALEVSLKASNRNELGLFRIYALLARYYNYLQDLENVKQYADLTIQNVPQGEREHFDVQIAHLLLALTHARQRNLPLGERELETAEELAGGARFQCYRAKAHLLARRYSSAIEIAQEAINNPQADPLHPCYYTLGNAYLARGNVTEAKKYLGEFLNRTGGASIRDLFIDREREEVNATLTRL